MKVRRGFYPLRKLTRVRKGPHFHHRAMAADYTIGLNAAGNGKMKINFFESSDLATFAPFTVNPESVSVVDGSICFEFAPTGDAAFYRFSVQ